MFHIKFGYFISFNFFKRFFKTNGVIKSKTKLEITVIAKIICPSFGNTSKVVVANPTANPVWESKEQPKFFLIKLSLFTKYPPKYPPIILPIILSNMYIIPINPITGNKLKSILAPLTTKKIKRNGREI